MAFINKVFHFNYFKTILDSGLVLQVLEATINLEPMNVGSQYIIEKTFAIVFDISVNFFTIGKFGIYNFSFSKRSPIRSTWFTTTETKSRQEFFCKRRQSYLMLCQCCQY